jgi:hypothetical protein
LRTDGGRSLEGEKPEGKNSRDTGTTRYRNHFISGHEKAKPRLELFLKNHF